MTKDLSTAVRVAARALGRAGRVHAYGHCSARIDAERFLVCPPRPPGLVAPGEPCVTVPVSGGLPEGVPLAQQIDPPHPIIQGRNDNGDYGWFGPRPPQGHGVHRYYFQVFALDQLVEVGPDTPLAELLNILKGHTIAQGEMMATYEAPTSQ